jgi:hypothetical protein
MTEITRNDVIDVGGGGGRCGEGVGVRSSTPAVAASFAADAGSEGGGGAEWQMVTRGKAKAGGPKRTTARTRAGVAEEGDSLQHAVPGFKAASTAARKRRAEGSINDKLAAMAATIIQLVMAQKQTVESQKAFLESNKAILDRNKALLESNQAMMETIKAQGDEIKALKALLQQSPRPSSYSEVTATSDTSTGSQAVGTRPTSANSSQLRKEKPQIQDDRAVSIDMGRFKGSKNNYNVIRDGLRAGLKVNKVTEKLTIKSLRPGPGDRIDVVFADKDEANKAKQHTRWLTSSLTGVRVKGEQWYPVKFDSVVKQCVLDQEVNDGKTLNKDFAKDFKADNGCETAECTVMKATWLSKVDVKKKVGSMVIWLKNKIDAEYLLRTGTAMFGATDAFCSPFIVRDNSGPCYHCNRYGHKQASCTSYIRCAICSKGHRRDECTNKDSPKCPACGDAHTVFDWACKLHPQHYRHVGQQKSRTRQEQRSAAMDIDMDISPRISSTDTSSVSGGAQVAGTASTSNTPSSSSC